MPITYQILRSLTRYNAVAQPLPETPASVSANVTGTSELELCPPVNAAAVDQAVVASIVVGTMRAMVIVSDVAMTVKVNSTSSPTATFSLAAATPVIWATGDAGSNPLGSTNVTTIYVSNPGVVAGTFTLNVLTP